MQIAPMISPDPNPLETFKASVEAFLLRSEMSAATFGRQSCNDGSFVFDLRDGKRECRFSTMRKVQAFMDEWDRANVGKSSDGRAA